MRRFDLFFAVILVPIDYLALLLAGSVAYFLRFADVFERMRPIIFELTFARYFPVMAIVALGWLVIFALSGLYTIGSRRKKLDEFKKIVIASTAAFGGVLAFVVFSRELFESRFILLVSWILAIVFVACLRMLARLARNVLFRLNIGLKQAAIIGSGASADGVAELLEHTPRFGFKVALRAETFNNAYIELTALAAQDGLDQIIYIGQNGEQKQMHELWDFADEHHISFRYSADLLATHGAGYEFDTLAGVPLMEIKRTRLEGWGRVYKRIFDIVGSALLIILSLPIMFLAALSIILESGFPILFCNERAGERGKIFNTLKFRTMRKKYCIGDQFTNSEKALEYEKKLIKEHSEKKGPVYKIINDPRVTRVGRFLRQTSIDELPQLFNVLAGQMTLVGPRPHQSREVEKYEKHHKRVLAIKPGITGLPQISGRSDLSFEEEVRLDTYYIEHWSLKLDLVILLKTPFAVAGQKGSY